MVFRSLGDSPLPPTHVSTTCSTSHRLPPGHQRHLRPAMEQSYAQPSVGAHFFTSSLPELASSTQARSQQDGDPPSYFESFRSNSHPPSSFNARDSHHTLQQSFRVGALPYTSESFPPHSSHGVRSEALLRDTTLSKASSSSRGQLSRAALRRIYGQQLAGSYNSGVSTRT